MAQNLPDKRLDVLEWLESHVTIWSGIADPANIGLTEVQVAAITAATTSARNAYDEVILIRANSKDATQTWYNAVDSARQGAAALVATIKAFAEATGNSNVYAQAGVSENADPSARPAPNTPANLTTRLLSSGAVELTWDASDAAFFDVKRRVNGAGPFTLAGSVASEKKFIDENIPPGTTSVSYTVTARRGTTRSDESEAILTLLGVPGESSAQATGGQSASA